MIGNYSAEQMARPSKKVGAARLVMFISLSVSLCFAACSKQQAAPRRASSDPTTQATNTDLPWFEEIAASAGIQFHHSSGHTARFYIPEMETGGVGLLDYDNDGWLDIFCVNGGSLDPTATNRPGCALYHNLGGWKFDDVTARAGIGGQGEYGMGCVCGDYNGDGRMDIYVTHLNGGILYRNNGDGTFTDVTRAAGIDTSSWGTSGAFFDYDGDGHLDLFVANYIKWSRETEITCYSRGGLPDYCSPLNYRASAMDALYHNKGDGTFENVTLAAGLDKAYGNGLGVVCADFNSDGRPDIFVANDATPNQLWINQGHGKFLDEAMIRGCAVNSMGMTEAGMGVATVDLFQHGSPDLFVTHLEGEGNRLWVNTNGFFTDTVRPKGPGAPSLAFTGFGLSFADFDNDGKLDLYVANGKVKHGQRQFDPKDPYAEPNTLLHGLGGGDFEEVKPAGGVAQPLIATSRGLAVGDFNNDGAMDVIVINRDGPAHLLRNRIGQHGLWIMFRVLNRNGQDAVNARVQIDAGGEIQWRDVIPNQGYCSSNDPRIHFGLGHGTKVDRVHVFWPDGTEAILGPFEARRIHELREGTAK
jgi:hypothetical protein